MSTPDPEDVSVTTTTREQSRAETMERIVAAARGLVGSGKDLSLRAVARELDLTAPALYRYAPSHDDLVRMVALAVDADVARTLHEAAEAWPADDPAARMIAGSVAFRRWALEHRHEFALVFTNVDVACLDELDGNASCGLFFADLLVQVWAKVQFPLPRMDELDPGLQEILRDPLVPADLSTMADELRPLVWVLQQSWAGLYGTVTLEVYGHVDPRLVQQGHLFRAFIEEQGRRYGLTDDMPRLRGVLDSLL